jgi:actin-related protein 2
VNKPPLSLIIDLGSGYLKCGPPSHPEPLVIPAALKSTTLGSGNPVFNDLDPGRSAWFFPFEDGLLHKDFFTVAELCNYALEQFKDLNKQRASLELMLLIFPQTQPELVTALCKTLQESLACLHVDAAIQQVLSWGYFGQKTALIIDVGYTVTYITPIYRGFLLDEQILSLITGSFFVSAEIRKLLLHRAETASSDHIALFSAITKDGEAISKIKESLCKVYPVAADNEVSEELNFSYQGTELPLGALPLQAPEVLFQPTLLGVGDKGLTDGIIEVLKRVDTSVRAELAANIVLSGGGSMLPGLKTRLENDLKGHMPHLTVKVYELEHPVYSSWLGAAKM